MAKGIFIGLAGIDIIYYSDRYPDKNEKSSIGSYATYTGGPAANEAITFSMLGGESTLITSIGESSMGRAILADLESYGVHTVDISKGVDILPFISAIMVDKDGERSIWSGQREFSKTDFRIDDYDYDFCMCDCYMYPHSLDILKSCHGKVPICLDVDVFSDEVHHYLKLADIAVMSSGVWKNMDVNALHPGLKVAITDDDKPIRIIDSAGVSDVGVESVEAIDTLGAGDIFHGAFAYYYYAQNEDFRESVRLASAIASTSVQYRGTREWRDHIGPECNRLRSGERVGANIETWMSMEDGTCLHIPKSRKSRPKQ